MAGGSATDWETVTPPSSPGNDWEDVSGQHAQTGGMLDAIERFGKGFYDKTLKGAVDTAGAVGHAVMNPSETATAVANSHPIDATVQAAKDAYQTHTGMLQQAKDAFQKGDYDSAIQHGTNALIPVLGPQIQAASDKAKGGDVAGGLGELSGMLASLGMAAPGAAESVIGKVGEAADAMGVSKPVGNLATKLYTSALKPSQVNPAEAAAAVQTGMDSGIPVSAKGKIKLDNLVQDLSHKVQDVIASDPNAKIDPQSVASRLSSTRSQFANQVNPVSDVATVDASRAEFLKQAGAKPGKPAIAPVPSGVLDQYGNPVMTAGTPAMAAKPAPPMAAADAQAMKQGTYSMQSKKAYGELKGAQVESEKALARGLKEELEAQFPELKNLNAAQAKLYTLDPYLQRGIARIGNHNILSLGDMVAGGAGGEAAGPAGIAGATVMRHVLGTPSFKSRLAIVLNKAAKTGGIPESAAATTARINSYVQSIDSALSAGAGATVTPAAALPMAAGGNQEQQ